MYIFLSMEDWNTGSFCAFYQIFQFLLLISSGPFHVWLNLFSYDFQSFRFGKSLDGLLSLDFQMTTPRTGWLIAAIGGTTSKLPWGQQVVLLKTPTWSHPPFGWPAEMSLKSRAVMTPITFPCYRPQVTVWPDKHSDLNSRVMETLETAQFGPVTSV